MPRLSTDNTRPHAQQAAELPSLEVVISTHLSLSLSTLGFFLKLQPIQRYFRMSLASIVVVTSRMAGWILCISASANSYPSGKIQYLAMKI